MYPWLLISSARVAVTLQYIFQTVLAHNHKHEVLIPFTRHCVSIPGGAEEWRNINGSRKDLRGSGASALSGTQQFGAWMAVATTAGHALWRRFARACQLASST